jgi:hypothetical protein
VGEIVLGVGEIEARREEMGVLGQHHERLPAEGLGSVAHLHEAPPLLGRKADERGELLLQEGECFVDGRQIGVGEVQRDDMYELQMASLNRRLVPEVDTLFFTPAEHYTYLSASLVREIASLGGDIGPFVHPAVASALVAKLRAGKC